MKESPYLSHFYRYLWEETGLLVVIGEGSLIFKGQKAYNEKYRIAAPEPECTVQLNRLLVAAGLAAVSLAERESWGWSLNIPGSLKGYFCAVEPEGMICGRMLESKPSARTAVVQRQKRGEPLMQSNFEAPESDPVEAVESYFEEAEQVFARVAVNDEYKGALVRALPGGRFSELDGLSDEEMVLRCHSLPATANMKILDEVLLFYLCRCDDEMIMNMIGNLPEQERRELWGNREMLEIECPRCGRGFVIRRKSG